jgi:hypothetical protein
MMRGIFACSLMLTFCSSALAVHAASNAAMPGTRVLMDAHNCDLYYE